MGGVSVETKLFRCDRLASYLELSGSELGNCLYCDKSTNHDHDIFGKIKFHPRDLKIFISLVVSDKRCDSGLVKVDEKQESLSISTDKKISKEDVEYAEDMKNLLSTLKSGVIKASNEKRNVTSTFKSKDFVYEINIPPPSKARSSSVIEIHEDPPLHLTSIQEIFSSKYGVEFKESRNVSKPQCNICLQVFKDETALRKHHTLHYKVKERRFSCQICSKRFLKQNHLHSHELLHSGVKPFECHLCSKKYSSEFALKNHRIHTHDEGHKPKCNECGKTFFTNSGVRKHVLRFHSKDLRLYCNECPRIYLRKDNLERHVRLVHRESKGIAPSEIKMNKKSSIESPKNGSVRASHPLQLDAQEEIDGLFGEDSNNIHRRGEVLNISGGLDASATEALLKNLTPQPDYLLKTLTPIPLEALEEMLIGTN